LDKKLGLKVISSAALAGILFTAAPMLPADAATDNYAKTVTKVEADDNQTLGSIIIKEDADSDGYFEDGNIVNINLPAGVEFSTTPSVTDEVYKYATITGGQSLKIVAAGDSFISFKIVGDPNKKQEDKITIELGDVDIDGDVTGDVKVEIEADGTPITSEFITVARVFGGGTATTIADVKTIALDTTGKVGVIKIAESTVGKLKVSDSDYITLTLPKDFEWKAVGSVQGTNGLVAKVVSEFGEKKLKLQVTDKSKGMQAGYLALSGVEIYVPDDAKNGDQVEVTIDGNETTKEDVVIAKVGDFGFKVETKGDLPTVIAGKTEQEVIEFSIDDTVKESWLENRTVKFELPTWAEFEENSGINADKHLKGSLNKDKDEVKFTVPKGTDGKVKFDKMEVRIDADAPEGDLVMKITGSQGIDEEVVIAKVLPPFKVKAEKPEFVIGMQNQVMGDIKITETEDEALVENKWIVVKAPNGMNFAKTPTVKITDGDLEIDDEDTDDNFFAFRIDSESAKKASEITISNIEMTLDRTVPVGDVTFDVYMTVNDAVAGEGDFDGKQFTSSTKFTKAIDKDSYEQVTSVVVATVTTPVQGEANSVVMNLGSTLYTVNGATKVMDVAPQVINGRTFTPVRYVAESLGAEVAYDDATKTATLTKGETVVEFVLGSSTYTVNGVAQTADVAAQAINGRTMLPARYVAEAFGYQVGFDPATKTVVISK
jgi:hypothetical protein